MALFLAECGRSRILAFACSADGDLTDRRVHAYVDVVAVDVPGAGRP